MPTGALAKTSRKEADPLGQRGPRAEVGRGDGREEGGVRLGGGDHERRLVREIDALHLLPPERAQRAELAFLGELPGGDEVLAGKWLSVVVAHVLAQREGVGQSIVADREAFGESGAQSALGRVAEEPVHHPFQDVEGGDGAGQPGVQRVELARRPRHQATTGARCTSRGGGPLRARRLAGLERDSLGTDARQCRDQARAHRAQDRLTAGQRSAAAGRSPSVLREEARPPRSPGSVSGHLGVQSTRLAGHAACERLREMRSQRRAFHATLAPARIFRHWHKPATR